MTETYPWDRTEPFIPAPNISLIVVPATPLSRFDHEGNGEDRVIGIRLGGVTIHLGLYGDDESLAVIDAVVEQLRELRDDIDRRRAGPLPTADDVLGILA